MVLGLIVQLLCCIARFQGFVLLTNGSGVVILSCRSSVFSLILWNDGSTIALLKAILLEFPYPSPRVDLFFECVDRAKAISSKFSVGSISYVLL